MFQDIKCPQSNKTYYVETDDNERNMNISSEWKFYMRQGKGQEVGSEAGPLFIVWSDKASLMRVVDEGQVTKSLQVMEGTLRYILSDT